jgi:hypothetical protein
VTPYGPGPTPGATPGPYQAGPYPAGSYGAGPGVGFPLAEELAQAPRSKRWHTVAPLSAALIAAAAIGVYVVRGSDGASGGASSPEAAVREAATAITQQDPAKLISLMNPGEVKTLGSLIDLIRGKVASTGAVSASGVLEPWLTLTLTGLTLKTQTVRNDLAFVELDGGSTSATVAQGQLPAAIRPANPQTRRTTGSLASAATALNGQPFVIAAIKLSGQWYLSPTTTILEDTRRDNNLPAPNFTAPAPIPTGSDTPEAAVTGFATAVTRQEYQAAAGFVSSREIPALPYYYQSLASEMQKANSQFAGFSSQLDTTVEDMSNGLKKVVIHGATLTGPAGTEQYHSYCVTTPTLSTPKCASARFNTLSGLKDPFLVVEQNNGKWQISPIATVLEYLRVVFTDGSLNAIYLTIGQPELVPVTATLPVGQATSVRLNDAGYAHVHVTGPANGCVAYYDQDGVDVSVPITAFGTAFGGSCEGFSLSGSGSLDMIVSSKDRYSQTVSVTLKTQ